MDFYLDAFLMENLLMNFAVLYITAWLVRIKPSIPRLTLSALLGAAYSCYSFLIGFGSDWMFGLSKVIVSFLMLLIAFHFVNIKSLLKMFAAFYGAGFLMAGAILGIMFAFKIPGQVENGVICWYYSSTALSLIMGVLTTVLIVKTFLEIFRRKEVDNGLRADLKVELNGKHLQFSGLLDTGNELRDPLSGTPIVVIEYKRLRDLFDEKTQKQLDNADDLVNAFGSIDDFKRRLRLIPFKSIGKSAGVLPGIRTDRLYITYGGKTNVTENSVLCVSNQSLSAAGEYEAIINPDILKNLKSVGGGVNVFKKSC